MIHFRAGSPFHHMLISNASHRARSQQAHGGYRPGQPIATQPDGQMRCLERTPWPPPPGQRCSPRWSLPETELSQAPAHLCILPWACASRCRDQAARSSLCRVQPLHAACRLKIPLGDAVKIPMEKPALDTLSCLMIHCVLGPTTLLLGGRNVPENRLTPKLIFCPNTAAAHVLGLLPA